MHVSAAAVAALSHKKMSYAMRRILGKFRKEPEDMWLTVQVSQVVLLSPDVIAVDESI